MARTPMRILLVDDSSAIRERVRGKVNAIGAVEVIGEADNVPRGIDLVRKLKPDIVILDISLPGGNGIEVLIEALDSETRSTMIVLTNHPYKAYRKICRKLGADFFFDKSREFNRLMDILEGLAGSRTGTQ